MTSLLIHPDETIETLEGLSQTALGIMHDHGGVGPFVNISMKTEDVQFTVMMGLDLSQPVNPIAREAIARLSGTYLMCMGPVLISGLHPDDAKEAVSHE